MSPGGDHFSSSFVDVSYQGSHGHVSFFTVIKWIIVSFHHPGHTSPGKHWRDVKGGWDKKSRQRKWGGGKASLTPVIKYVYVTLVGNITKSSNQRYSESKVKRNGHLHKMYSFQEFNWVPPTDCFSELILQPSEVVIAPFSWMGKLRLWEGSECWWNPREGALQTCALSFLK